MTDLRQLVKDVEQLREDVDYLTALLEPGINGGIPGLVGVPAGPAIVSPQQQPFATPGPANAFVWHDLKPTEAAKAWTALTSWVDWLVVRYQLDDNLPDCWYRHGAIVAELDALRAAWNGAYLDAAARPADGAYWHELLNRAMTRIHEWDRYGCAAGTHHDEVEATPDSATRALRDEFVFADIDSRATRRHHETGTS
jgi:hypothetical protein